MFFKMEGIGERGAGRDGDGRSGRRPWPGPGARPKHDPQFHFVGGNGGTAL
jgi:hypothetical protein